MKAKLTPRVKKAYKLKVGNLSGKVFGKWTVVERDLTKTGTSYWVCKCSCGRKRSIQTRSLKDKKSQGCLECSLEKRRIKGYGQLPGRYWKNIKSGAKQRNLNFSITVKFAWELFLKQNKRCNLSGIQLTFDPMVASLDRIDSSKGYSKKNVQWVHRTVNKMKNDIKQETFIKFCKMIAKDK